MSTYRKLGLWHLILIVCLIFHVTGFSYKDPIKTITIHEIMSFPPEPEKENELFLHGSIYMDKDSFGNIYISNSKGGNIFCFNREGDYLSTIGMKGQGPGELSYPAKIMALDDNVIVQDHGNHKLQVFNKTGKALSSIRLFKTYRDMVIDKKQLIMYAVPMLSGNPKENLLDVLGFDGKVLASFGIPIEYKYKMSTLNSAHVAIMDNGELILGFEFHPIIRRYSPKGKLLAEHRMEYEPAVAKGKENIASYRKSLAKRTNPAFYMITNCLRVDRNRVFILSIHPGITIMEYDSNLRLKNVYVGETEKDFYANDFIINEVGGRLFFYLLQVIPENVVRVYSPS